MHPRTLPELFLDSVETHDKPDALQVKRDGRYVAISSRELRRRVEDVCYGLMSLGMEAGHPVALISENRPEWAVADLAILCGGGITVPVYTTLTTDQTEYILRNCGARICVVSTGAQLSKVQEVRGATAIQRIVAFDSLAAQPDGVLSIEQVGQAGERHRLESPGLLERRLQAIEPESVATILYTSGTTGRPKGVMLSHRNILSNVEAVVQLFRLRRSDVHLSFLPLCHGLERMGGHFTMLHVGATIAYAEAIESVARNMLEVRPTLTIGVPRFYEKVYGRVLGAALAAPALQRKLFSWATAVGERVTERRLSGRRVGARLAAQHAVARRLVFKKLLRRMGGRMRMFLSGGAPLSPRIASFFWAADLPILEGYGLTEASPVISVNTLEHARLGTVGRPIPGVQVRIAEDGEVLCSGPNVMLGYYGMPDETAATIVDGWLKTGDIGHLDADGFLAITDRKKDLIKTSGGKYVAPQAIENSLRTNKFIAQAVVVGNDRKYVTVLLVPNFETLREHLVRAGVPAAARSEAELLREPAVRELYAGILKEVNRDLAPFETLKDFQLLDRDFSVESGELTPTLKVKRRVVEERYGDLIEAMYKERLSA